MKVSSDLYESEAGDEILNLFLWKWKRAKDEIFLENPDTRWFQTLDP